MYNEFIHESEVVDKMNITSLLVEETSCEDQPSKTDDKPKEINFISDSAIVIQDDKNITIFINGPIYSSRSYSGLIKVLLSVDSTCHADMFINSPGGDLSIAAMIIDAMILCKADITTHNVGTAMSCGSLILGYGDKIIIHPLSITMFHSSANSMRSTNTHHAVSLLNHNVTFLHKLFDRMRVVFQLTDDEVDDILKRGKNLYLTSADMISRSNDVLGGVS